LPVTVVKRKSAKGVRKTTPGLTLLARAVAQHHADAAGAADAAAQAVRGRPRVGADSHLRGLRGENSQGEEN
jgi:hypothetical protein